MQCVPQVYPSLLSIAFWLLGGEGLFQCLCELFLLITVLCIVDVYAHPPWCPGMVKLLGFHPDASTYQGEVSITVGALEGLCE